MAGFSRGYAEATFDYLGFTPYGGRSRSGKARLKRKTSTKRLRHALVEINNWLCQERNTRKLPNLWRAVSHQMREARAVIPQAGFCEGEALDRVRSNHVTLPKPKGGSKRGTQSRPKHWTSPLDSTRKAKSDFFA
jgi:hypothetical protein